VAAPGTPSPIIGGWAPELLVSETGTWPAAVLPDLRGPGGSDGDFREASEQIGVTETNDFVFGKLRKALRKRLFDGITANRVTGAVPLTSPDLPLHLDNIPANEKIIAKLEAPLAVQGRTPRSGFFPLSKFSAVPLIMQAARAAVAESGNDDVKKRFMIVSNCHPPTMSRQRSGCGEHHRCQRRVVRQLQTGRGEAFAHAATPRAARSTSAPPKYTIPCRRSSSDTRCQQASHRIAS